MPSPHLEISRQDIVLSPELVKINYTLVNDADEDITETLVFSLPSKIEVNFTVDRQPVSYKTMERAISINGKDITQLLTALGLPLNPISAMHALDMSRNRDSIITKLHAMNLVDEQEETPTWNVKSYYFWQQKFTAHNSISIEQRYKPQVINYSIKPNNFSEILKMPIKLIKKIVNVAINWTLEDNNAADSLQIQFEKFIPQMRHYCPQPKDYQALATSYKKQPARKPNIDIKELHFVQETENTWANPIGRFSLSIEAPKNLYALACWQDDLKRAGNGFSFYAENYVPLQNLDVLFVEK